MFETASVANLPRRPAPALSSQSSHRGGGWGEAYGIHARTEGQGLPGDRRSTYGFAGGVSYAPLPWLMMGFAVDQGRIDIDVPDVLERGQVDLTQIGALARLSSGPFALALSATYGFGSADVTRALLGVASASYDVRLWGGLAEASYRFNLGPWRVVPKAGFDYVRIETDGFAETGAFGLVAAANEADRSRAFAGLEVGRSFALSQTARLDLSAHARAIALLDGGERTLPAAFAMAPGAGLVIRGLTERTAGVDLGAQSRLNLTTNAALYAAYEGRFRDGYTAHAGTGGLKIVW